MPQRITVMTERTMKSFGMYSYLGGWLVTATIGIGYIISAFNILQYDKFNYMPELEY